MTQISAVYRVYDSGLHTVIIRASHVRTHMTPMSPVWNQILPSGWRMKDLAVSSGIL